MGGLATHTPGTADLIGQSVETRTGKWYRLAFTVTGRTAGTVTPRLIGRSTRPGEVVSGNGGHLYRIQAVRGNNRPELRAQQHSMPCGRGRGAAASLRMTAHGR